MTFAVVTIYKNGKDDNIIESYTAVVPKKYLSEDNDKVFYPDVPSSLDDIQFISSFVESGFDAPPNFILHNCKFDYDASSYDNALILVEAIDKKQKQIKNSNHTSILTYQAKFQAELGSNVNKPVIASNKNTVADTSKTLFDAIIPLEDNQITEGMLLGDCSFGSDNSKNSSQTSTDKDKCTETMKRKSCEKLNNTIKKKKQEKEQLYVMEDSDEVATKADLKSMCIQYYSIIINI